MGKPLAAIATRGAADVVPPKTKANMIPRAVAAATLIRATTTKRAGSGSGRANQSVQPRFHKSKAKPAPRSPLATTKNGIPVAIAPSTCKKPQSRLAIPATRQTSVGSDNLSLNKGRATRTGTNCVSAPDISKLNQPSAEICTSTKVSEDSIGALGKP